MKERLQIVLMAVSLAATAITAFVSSETRATVQEMRAQLLERIEDRYTRKEEMQTLERRIARLEDECERRRKGEHN